MSASALILLSLVVFPVFSMTFEDQTPDHGAADPPPGFIVYPVAHSSSTSPEITIDNETRYKTTGYIVRVANPLNHWHVNCPGCSKGNCTGKKEKTDEQAKEHACTFAANGGPFSMKGEMCIGPVISDGVVTNHQAVGYACVGMTTDGHWVMGTNIHPEFFSSFDNLLCGFGWLVYNGTALASSQKLIAPRTTIGINKKGELINLLVYGVEDNKIGTNLTETAEWMASLGALYAINMDGGGSTAGYYLPTGGVIGCPTCIDTPKCCVRPVTTITCVK